MEKRLGIALFVLLLVFTSGCATLTADPLASFPPWLPVAFIAIIMSFFIVSIAYMAGNALDNPELVAWAKNELYQTAAMAIMVGLLFFFYSFLDTMLIPGLTAGVNDPAPPYNLSDNSVMIAAQEYLYKVHFLLGTQFSSIVFLQVVIGVWEGMTIRMMPGGIGFTISLYSIFIPLSHFIGFALNATSIALWSIHVQSAVLNFANMYMFSLFLPLGIVLRSFPFTRSIGGAIIAVAIGLYVVYPLTFVLNMSIVDSHYENSIDVVNAFNAAVFRWSYGDLLSNGAVMDPFNTAWFIVKIVFSSVAMSMSLLFQILFALIGVNSIVEDTIFSIVAYAIVLPVLNVFITLTMTRAIANLMGSDVNLNSITNLL